MSDLVTRYEYSLVSELHGTVRVLPGGVAELAARIGVNERTLQNKLCPTTGTHRLTAGELAAIAAVTHCAVPADHLARLVGRITLPVGDLPLSGGVEAGLLELTREFAEAVKALSGPIRGRHRREAVREVQELAQAAFALVQQLEAEA